MTERTQSPHADLAEEERAHEGIVDEPRRSGWSAAPVRLRVALPLSVLGAGLVALGPTLGLVDGQPAAGFAAQPLLIALAVAAPLLAIVALAARRPVIAAGVLIGAAVVAPGRLLVDLQFARDALLASRPELMVPTSLTPLPAATGLWVLIAGHVAVGLAGLLVAGRAGAEPGSAYAQELDDPAGAPGLTGRHYLIGWAFACATLAVVGLMRPTFRSHNAFQLAREVIESPGLVRAGGLLVVAAVVLGCVVAAGLAPPQLARGVLLGLLVAVAGVTLPGIVAGLTVDRLVADIGPYLALGAIGVLTLVVFLMPGAPAEKSADKPAAAELRLESGRLHPIAGLLGILTGLAALGGGLGSQLVVDAGLEQPVSFANRQLVPAGVLVALLGAALLVRAWSTTVRPAFTVALASVPMVGASTLDAALTGAGISPAVRVGAGVWSTALAITVALAAAACAGIAGSAERDDVDLTERRTNAMVVAPAAAAVLFAVGAFALPAVRAPGFVAPDIWSNFRLTSWGLVLGLVVVVAAAVLAPRSRPARAASLLLGAAAVVGVHLLELPLTGDRAPDASAGPGTLLSVACVATLLIAAFVAVALRPAPQRGR
ncbi:MAG TPA: hypothetical protein VGX25_11055 [Actinophytocola sp.]|uniref:hypothetical protein n=1 Tax=Actinophytocola sp. TaxID=1872138 RepID=UPI002DDD9364|nr:hypothetical protein [Actinophytocola sp.]HEV2779924.1 hypothetical protein [Actinophytocola sp.]